MGEPTDRERREEYALSVSRRRASHLGYSQDDVGTESEPLYEKAFRNALIAAMESEADNASV